MLYVFSSSPARVICRFSAPARLQQPTGRDTENTSRECMHFITMVLDAVNLPIPPPRQLHCTPAKAGAPTGEGSSALNWFSTVFNLPHYYQRFSETADQRDEVQHARQQMPLSRRPCPVWFYCAGISSLRYQGQTVRIKNSRGFIYKSIRGPNCINNSLQNS